MSGKQIARIGDKTDHGGVVISGEPTITIDNMPIARIGDMVSCPKCEGTFPIISGVDHFFGQGKLVAVVGSKTSCGATIITGAPTATAGGPLVTVSIAAPSKGPEIMAAQSFRPGAATPSTDEEWCERRQEIKDNEEVIKAMEDAYSKSHQTKKENGGWIVRDEDGELKAVPMPEGGEYGIRMGDAPEGAEGWYHTHPNSTHESEDEASDRDMLINKHNGIMGVVMGPYKTTYSTPSDRWLLCP